jgi:hypothetical protein
MSEFNGLVKGRSDLIVLAMTEYEAALDIAKTAYNKVKQLSIIETREAPFLWLWKKQYLVKNLIIKDYENSGWHTGLHEVYSEYYPELFTPIQADIVSEAWRCEYIEIKKMIKHNSEVWLTPEQAEWVSVWSNS